MKRVLAVLSICLGLAASGRALPEQQQAGPWKQLDEGLALGEFESPVRSTSGDSKITVVRVDPKLYGFKLLSAGELKERKMTAKDWSNKYQLLAAVNAGMYAPDGLTSVGYLRNFKYVNNGKLNKGMKAVLAFNRTDPSVPEIQIIDRRCQDFDQLKGKYNTLIQGIRMIGCKQKNVWNKADDLWSMVVFGIDKGGRAMLIFTQSPYSPHDFINLLLALPLELESAMYLEGGSEASLYLSAGGLKVEKFGTHGTGFLGLFKNSSSWPLPNVIGVVKK